MRPFSLTARTFEEVVSTAQARATTWISGKNQKQTSNWFPELYLVAAWTSSLLALVGWQVFWIGTHPIDCVVAVMAHMFCLPITFRNQSPLLVPAAGCIVTGIATAYQLIDVSFDWLIITDRSPDGGVTPARKAAWMYYNTMLNSLPVNFGIECFLLVGLLGTLVGVGRSSPCVRAKWIRLTWTMALGNTGYLLLVIPRYIDIRASEEYQSDFFDGWRSIFAARLLLFAALGRAMGQLGGILQEDPMLTTAARRDKQRSL